MYLNKYDIKGETYVKLDEHEDNPGWMMAHSQLTDIARKRASWDVRESVYNSYSVGDWFAVEEVINND